MITRTTANPTAQITRGGVGCGPRRNSVIVVECGDDLYGPRN